MSASDAADYLKDYTISQRSEIMNYVNIEHAGDILSVMDSGTAGNILSGMYSSNAGDILGNMGSSELGDFLGSLGSSTLGDVLGNLLSSDLENVLGNLDPSDLENVVDNLGMNDLGNVLSNLNLDTSELTDFLKSRDLSSLELAELLDGMDLSSLELSDVLDAMDLDISSLSDVLGGMDLSSFELGELLGGMDLSSLELSELLGNMDLSSLDLSEFLNGMDLDISSLSDFLGSLNLDASTLADLLGSLDLSNLELADLLGGMDLSSIELGEVLGAMGLDTSSLSEVLTNLDLSIFELGEVLGSLDPSIAADIFSNIDPSVAAAIFSGMDPGIVSDILGSMGSSAASSIMGFLGSGFGIGIDFDLGADDCDWGDAPETPQTPFLSLTDDDAPDYENMVVGIVDAYIYHKGSINVTNDGTPEANITVKPEGYVKEGSSNEHYCFKTLLLDLDDCEVLDRGSSVDEKDYAFTSSQDRVLQQYERSDSYAFGYSSTPIARCTRVGDLGRGESEDQEMELVINSARLLLAASKPSYTCSEYDTEYACSRIDECVWDEELMFCEFQPYDDFTDENQVKYWLMESATESGTRCVVLESYGAASDHALLVLNDPMYKALVEHYHSGEGEASLADLAGDDPPPDLPEDPLTFYNIQQFFGIDEVYATFFEAWAKYYIRSLGGMDESERLYCYKTDLRDDSYCYERPYLMYSFGDNDLLSIDEKYIQDVKNWNYLHPYINEMPDESKITNEKPAGEVISESVFDGSDITHGWDPAWRIIWIKVFMMSPVISLGGSLGWGKWGYTGVETDRYVGSGQDRKDACELSCRYDPENCNLLMECDPFDPMDDDKTQYDHCNVNDEVPEFDLCSGFDSRDDPDDVFQTGSCTLYRGADDECTTDDAFDCECKEYDNPDPPPPDGVDCWGGPGQNEPCEIITQYHLMRDCPPKKCYDTGFNQAGFVKYDIPWYTRQWGYNDIAGNLKLTGACSECDECKTGIEDSSGHNLDTFEEKESAPGPLCLTKYILEGGGEANTSFTIGLSANANIEFDEPHAMNIHKISDNIWMVDGGYDEFKIIDTGNVPFEITCAYWIAKEPYECKNPNGCTDITAVRYYKSKLAKWSAFTIDSDIFTTSTVNASYMKLIFPFQQRYLTGVREDKFYTACDRFSCNCDECICGYICDCGEPYCVKPEYKWCKPKAEGGSNDDVCGGISEKAVFICPCFKILEACFCGGGCYNQFREEIKSSYHEQNTTKLETAYHVYNWEKEPWIYNGAQSKFEDAPIDHHLVLDATRYQEGDFITTYGFINFTIQPDLFRGMSLRVGDSDAEYQKLITTVNHGVTAKKSSYGAPAGSGLSSRYSYESEIYEFPPQCENICYPPPVCECAPEDITKPLCMNMSPIVYRDGIEDLLCEHYADDPVVGKICDDGSIQGNKQAISDLCGRYLAEIDLAGCELELNRVYCYEGFETDALYMACYGDRLIERDDCVCAPDKRYDNPCDSLRNFHEPEGSVIVNGDFEMGFDTGFGPWQTVEGEPRLGWMGRNGYSLFLPEGSSIIQHIPEGATPDPGLQLCLEFGSDSSKEATITITIDAEGGHSSEIAKCELGWKRACFDVPTQIRSIELEAEGSDIVVDNVNLGKGYDFVIYGNTKIEDLTQYGFSALQSMGGFNKLVVVDIKNGTSDAVFEGGHYYTMYFRTGFEPYRNLYSGEEDYDIIPRKAFEEGKLFVDTFYERRTLNLGDADEFKIRDAVGLFYTVGPEGAVSCVSPGSEVTVSILLYNFDKNRGESGKKVYVWSEDVELSSLDPAGLSEDEDGYFVETDADGSAEFTLKAYEAFSLEMKHYGDVDPTGRSLNMHVRVNVSKIYTPLLSPQILVLILILVVAAFSYKFLGVGRMQLESWLDDLRGNK